MKILQSLKLRWVAWVWHHTPNCQEMSRLASLSFEQTPSVALRFKMRLHHLICVWCRRYERQLRFLRRAALHWHELREPVTKQGLSPEARRRIRRRLEQG